MNCRGSKSAIVVRDKKTFVDILVEQVVELNRKYQADVPLMFMNSFNTHGATERIIGRSVETTRILSFCQHSYPRLLADDSGFLDPKKKILVHGIHLDTEICIHALWKMVISITC